MHLSSPPTHFHNFVCERFTRSIIAPKHQKTSQALGEHRPQSSETNYYNAGHLTASTLAWRKREQERNKQTNKQ